MFPDAASLATPAGNGAIGAARETPTPAAKMKAATAIANAVRIIAFSSMDEFMSAELITHKQVSSSTTLQFQKH
jgi:hypothetical protein